MRFPLASLILCWFLLPCLSCADESAPPATVASKPAAPKPRPKPAEPATASLQPSPLVVEALARAKQPAAPAPSKRALPRASTVHGSLDSAKLGSRGLLHWMPPDAAIVLRLPHVESLGE